MEYTELCGFHMPALVGSQMGEGTGVRLMNRSAEVFWSVLKGRVEVDFDCVLKGSDEVGYSVC